MIDWIHKLPDSAIGLVAAGAVWLGFNYSVLGERAMERYSQQIAMPACMASIDQPARPIAPRVKLGKLLGMPELDAMTDQLIEEATPPGLSHAEQVAKCEAAVLCSSATMRLDFALSTAWFRYFTPDSIATFRQRAAHFLTDGSCTKGDAS